MNIAPTHSFAAPPITNFITGTIFDDYNQNGVQDNREPGLGGVVVTVYNRAGTVLDAQSSQFGATLGVYTLGLQANVGPVRVQFSNFGSSSTVPNLIGYQPSEHARVAGSVQGGTTVAFVNGNQTTNTVNLGLARPSSFCQANPNVVTNCYVRGNQTNAANAVLVKYAYNATGTSPAPSMVADSTQVGSTWGLAYRRSTGTLFAAAYTKLLTGYKPGGNPGDIYLVNGADSASPTATASAFVTLNAGTNPHNPTNNYLPDASAYDAVGKTAIGGLALSEDESTLYAVNLFNRSLYSIPIGAPPAPPIAGTPTSVAIPAPANCITAVVNFRPFAVSVYEGNVYVGAVCSAESTQSSLDLHAYVLKYNPVTSTFSSTPVLDIPLNYPRHCADKSFTNPQTCLTTGYAAAWKPWQPSSSVAYAAPGSGGTVYPQPQLSSIVFDNGDMILGLRDRYGDQTGHGVPGVPEARGAGDTLRACLNTHGNLSSGWTLETNGTCGNITTNGAGNGKGVGGGEYYYTQTYPPFHDHIGLGGLLQIPGFTGVMSNVYDPVTTILTAGVRTYDNVTGSTSNAYQVYSSSAFPTTYGKANGLGSLVAFCQAAPIEIGDRVWLDTNGNGIQDAGEPNIVGATVHLYASNGTTLVGTATTNAQGNYFFNNSDVTNTDSTLGLKPYTGYMIKLDNPTDYAIGGPLSNYQQLTVKHQDPNALIDSKATLPQAGQPIGAGNYPQITVNAHIPGQNDHTFDIGFTAPPDLRIVQTPSSPGYLVGATASYTLQVTNETDIGLVVSPNPITVTYTVPTGLSGVTASAPSGWTFSPAGPVDSPTSITATYTGLYPVTQGEALQPITITGTVNSSAGATLTTTATVGTPGDTNTLNELSIVTVTVTAPTTTTTPTATPTPAIPPNLAINLNNSVATTAQVGQNITYTLTVSNNATAGPVVSPNPIIVTFPIPVGLDTITLNGTGWTLSPNPVSGSSPVTITATYNGPFPVGSVTLPVITVNGTLNAASAPGLTVTAHVTTADDSDLSDNFSTDTILVSPLPTTPVVPPNLAINLSNSVATTAQVGQNITYTLAVSNNATAGPVVSPDPIIVTFPIPVGLDTITLNGAGWTLSPNPVSGSSPVTITATYNGPFPVGSVSLPVITVNGTLNAASVPDLTATAYVTTEDDSDLSDNSSTNTILVSPIPTQPPDVALTLTNAGGNTFTSGDTVHYSVTVTNVIGSGPVTQPSAIIVTDVIPVGLTNIVVTAPGWNVSLFNTTSPSSITARYLGIIPVTGGTTLPLILISGTLANTTNSTLTTLATESTPGDINPPNDSQIDTVYVNPLPPPNVSITLNNTTGNSYQVGQPATYAISVANAPDAGPVTQPEGIVVTSVLPVGLTNVTVSGQNWSTTLTSTTSPGTFTATYVGVYPVGPGIVLPALILTGIPTAAAQPALTLTATVTTSNGSTSTQSSATGTIFVAPAPPLDVAVALSNMNGNTFHVGDQVTYVLGASVVTGLVMSPHVITVTYVVPAGLSNVQVYGHNWSINLNDTVSPLLLIANYTGAYPVATGGLPLIIITGKLTQDAEGSLTATAQVGTFGDSNPANNTAVDTIFVQQEQKLCQHNDNGNNHNQNDRGGNLNQCRNSQGNGIDQSQSFDQYHSQ